MEPRRTTISVTYNGKNISARLEEYLAAFSYQDEASGSGDDISLVINDRDRKWIGPWFPEKGDILGAEILLENWTGENDIKKISCGAFTIDEVGFSGFPVKLTLKAIAIPAATSFRERERSKTWENTTLENIARTIAERYGIGLYYETAGTTILRIEQSDQDDCSFLNEIVTRYGFSLKIYKNKIVIFDEAVYEKRKSVATLTPENVEPNWNWKTRLEKTYTGARYEYTDRDAGLLYTVDIGSGDRILKVTDSSMSLAEARAITLARINDSNKNDTSMSLILTLANPKIVATSCVDISGFGNLDGKYYVQKVSWEVSSGVKQHLTMRKIGDRFTTATAMAYKAIED